MGWFDRWIIPSLLPFFVWASVRVAQIVWAVDPLLAIMVICCLLSTFCTALGGAIEAWFEHLERNPRRKSYRRKG